MKTLAILSWITLLTLGIFPSAFGSENGETAAPRRSESSRLQYRNAFLPGLSASWLVPFESSKRYQGANFHYAFIQGITRSTGSMDFGGYYESYLEIGYYKEQSSSFNQDIFFSYSLGMNLSFEKFLTSDRSFLIPYFGARAGGIYMNDPSGGGASLNGFVLEPVMGLVVFLSKGINLNLDSSLFLNTVDLPGLIGLRHSLVVNINL